MKKILTTLAILFSLQLHAQWIDISLPAWYTIQKASFLDDNNGYVIATASFHVLFKTTNGGTTWDSLPLPYSPDDIEFLTINNGFILMQDGPQFYLGTTTNGGITWATDSMPAGITFEMVRFYDANTGYATTDVSTIYKTTNGGQSWNLTNLGNTVEFRDKDYISPDTIIFTGWDGSNNWYGSVIQSTDGGASFQANNTNTFYSIFTGSHFINGTTGMAVYNNPWHYPNCYILRTTNAGVTWDTMATDTTTNMHFQDVFMISANEAYVVAQSLPTDQGHIYHAVGTTVTLQLTTPGLPLNRLYKAGNTLFAVGQMNAFKLSLAIGVEDELTSKAMVYPNPFGNKFILQLDPGIQLNNAELIIRDVHGRECICLSNIDEPTIEVNRKDLCAGIYFYTLSDKGKTIARGKLIAQ